MFAIDEAGQLCALDFQMLDHRESPLALIGFPGSLARATLPGSACAWPPAGLGAATPGAVKPLSLSLQATPASIPSLPLLSPGATPSLGIGTGGLASCTSGRSLEHVVSVATDPLSLHFVNLNMETVDVSEEDMDALMEGRFPHTLTAAHLRHTPGQPAALGAAQAAAAEAEERQGGPGSTGGATTGSMRCCDTQVSNGSTAEHAPRSASAKSQASRHSVPSSEGHSHGRAAGGAAHGDSSGDAGACGQHHRPDLTVSFLEENGYFDITLQAAAAQLGVGVTTLKKLCRQNGLGRWPYRARCSLRNLRDKMREYFATAPADERDAADALMEREFCRLARMNVGAIDDAVKQFRQAMFKLEFKARQQLEAGRGNGGARKRPVTEEELQGVIHNDCAIRQQAMLHLRRLLAACGEAEC